MSNKLVKHQESKEILTVKQKKILLWICFIIFSIAFITVWINILLTSKAFNTQMEEMVLGEDYYMEAFVITGKRAENASAFLFSLLTLHVVFHIICRCAILCWCN